MVPADEGFTADKVIISLLTVTFGEAFPTGGSVATPGTRPRREGPGDSMRKPCDPGKPEATRIAISGWPTVNASGLPVWLAPGSRLEPPFEHAGTIAVFTCPP